MTTTPSTGATGSCCASTVMTMSISGICLPARPMSPRRGVSKNGLRPSPRSPGLRICSNASRLDKVQRRVTVYLPLMVHIRLKPL
jgi:hypothetical protein